MTKPRDRLDILLEMKEKNNIWIDVSSREIKGKYRGREYAVPLTSEAIIDWDRTQGSIKFMETIKSHDATPQEFKEEMENSIARLVKKIHWECY